MTRVCTVCAKPLYRQNKSGLCRSHNIEALLAKGLDTNRAKAAESIRAWAMSAEGNAQVRAAGEKGRASWSAETKALAKAKSGATRKALFEASLAWCPADRRIELQRLIKTHGAEEGRRIMRDDLAAVERRRLAAMTPFERQMDAVKNGTRIVAKFTPRRADPSYTLGGVVGAIA